MVAFSGTDVRSAKSVSVSADLRLAPLNDDFSPFIVGKGVKVHRGFRDCFDRVKTGLWKIIEQEVAKGVKSITLAGYSLGECKRQVVTDD